MGGAPAELSRRLASPPPAGFAELCRLNGRFEAFSKSLFSQAGLDIDRELQAKEFNEKLSGKSPPAVLVLSEPW